MRYPFSLVLAWPAFLICMQACAPSAEPLEQIRSEAGAVAPPAFLQGPEQSTSGAIEVTIGPSPTPDVTYRVEHTADGETWTVGYDGPETKVTLRVDADGVYGLQARACLGAVCSAPTAMISIPVTLTFPDYLQSQCPEPLPGVAPQQDNIGALAAEAGVSGGSATVQVAIRLPPGRAAMTPEVSLTYASSRGDGLAGVGWSSSAASMIGRCGRTPHFDGEVRNVTFSASDRLCLDGQRLVLASGSYGQDGARYRTAVEGFARITQHGDIQGASTWFEVEAKDGGRSLYGALPGQLDAVEYLTGSPAPAAWWLARREDQRDNRIEYEYARLGDTTVSGQPHLGQHLLSSIRYSGRPGVVGDRAVTFEYELRPDKKSGFVAGALRRSIYRLAAVNASVQGRLTRRYELTYALSRATARSLLESVQECLSDPCTPETSMPATTFEYQDAAPSFEWVDVTTEEYVRERLGSDYDGDGFRDGFRIVYPEPWGGAPSANTLTLSASGTTLDVLNGPGRAWWDGFNVASIGLQTWGNSDFDQDGRADLMGFIDQGNGPVFAIRTDGITRASNVPAPSAPYVPLWVGDFDGNGRSDVAWTDAGVGLIWLQRDPPAGSASLHFDSTAIQLPALAAQEAIQQVADFDGDGLPDFFLDWSGAYPRPTGGYEPKIVFTERGPSGGLSFRVASIPSLGGPHGPVMSDGSIPTSSFNELGDGRFADVNGDGLPDIVTGAPIYINTGGAFRRGLHSTQMNWDLVRRDRDPLFDIDIDYDADGITERISPDRSQAVLEWCYSDLPSGVDGADDEWLYCTFASTSARSFDHGVAPKSRNRSVHTWRATEWQDDGLGFLTSPQVVTTGIQAVLGARVDDYGADGLPDVVSDLYQLYGPTPEPTPTGPANPPAVTGYYRETPRPSLGTKVARNRSGAPDLLIRTVNGLGHTSAWTHRPLSAPESVEGCASPAGVPFYRANHAAAGGDHDHFIFASSMNVVARFDSSNGIGGSNPTCFRYEDAMANNQGRGFVGFRRLIEESALGDGLDLRTTSTFHQRGDLAGRPFDVQVHLASEPLDALPIERTSMEWKADCRASADATERARSCFVRPEVTYSTQRDLSSRVWVSTSTTVVAYEGLDLEYGNVTRQERHVEDSSTRHSELISNTFDYSDVASWWINRLAGQVVTKAAAEYLVPPLMATVAHPENAPKTTTVDYQYLSGGPPLGSAPPPNRQPGRRRPPVASSGLRSVRRLRQPRADHADRGGRLQPEHGDLDLRMGRILRGLRDQYARSRRGDPGRRPDHREAHLDARRVGAHDHLLLRWLRETPRRQGVGQAGRRDPRRGM